MRIPTLKAIALVAACSLSTAVFAQKTYKCADTYSQLPCLGGVVVNTVDQRTSAQKTQTESATRRDARIADAMEKARLAQEKRELAANTPPVTAVRSAGTQKTDTKQVKKKRKKEPEYFTAQVPGAKKKALSTKKNTQKKDPKPS